MAGYGVLVGSYWQELARGWVGSAALMWRDQPRFQAMLDAGDALREAHIARLRLGAIFPTSHCHKGGLSA